MDEKQESEANESDALIASLLFKTLAKIESRDPELVELLRATAIPHFFDFDTLNCLLGINNRVNLASLLMQIDQFSFIYKNHQGNYSYHEIIRDILLKSWRVPDQMQKYVYYNTVLRKYYEDRNNDNEALYHWLAIEPEIAYSEFSNRISKVLNRFELVEAEILIRLLREQNWNLSPKLRISVTYYEATLKRLLSKWKDAITIYNEVLLGADLITLDLRSATLNGLASCMMYTGQLTDAKKILEESLAISKEHGNTLNSSNSLLTLGWVDFRLGNFQGAIISFEEAIALSITMGDVSKQGSALSNLGRVYRELKLWDKSIDYYQQSLSLRKLNKSSDFLIGTNLANLAKTFIDKGDLSVAYSYLQDALSVHQIENDPFRYAIILGVAGYYYQKTTIYEEAVRYYEIASSIFAEIDAKQDLIEINLHLADIFSNLNDVRKANYHTQLANEIKKQLQKLSEENRNDSTGF